MSWDKWEITSLKQLKRYKSVYSTKKGWLVLRSKKLSFSFRYSKTGGVASPDWTRLEIGRMDRIRFFRFVGLRVGHGRRWLGRDGYGLIPQEFCVLHVHEKNKQKCILIFSFNTTYSGTRKLKNYSNVEYILELWAGQD